MDDSLSDVLINAFFLDHFDQLSDDDCEKTVALSLLNALDVVGGASSGGSENETERNLKAVGLLELAVRYLRELEARHGDIDWSNIGQHLDLHGWFFDVEPD